MALSTTQYGYIIDPMVPFTDGKGNTIKDGFVRVFVAGSSTPVITYRNFDGAANQDLIELDNSGRTKTSVIGSKGLTYKVCVYDQLHSQESPILTVDKVSAIGANITAGAGATVVTGLDGFTTKPDGFVDASVIGTDGYVALDHTLVTDDLNTDAKVTAVENDRYIPLLNNDVNDPDSKMTLGRLWQWVLGKIKSLSTTITAFRTGDVIPVDGPNGPAKMPYADLLRLAAEEAPEQTALSFIKMEQGGIISDGSLVSNSIRIRSADYIAGNVKLVAPAGFRFISIFYYDENTLSFSSSVDINKEANIGSAGYVAKFTMAKTDTSQNITPEEVQLYNDRFAFNDELNAVKTETENLRKDDYSISTALVWNEGFVNWHNGNTEAGSGYSYCDKVEIDSFVYNKLVVYAKASDEGNAGIAFYDENDVFLYGEPHFGGTGTSVQMSQHTIPQNAKYFSFSTKTDSITKSRYILDGSIEEAIDAVGDYNANPFESQFVSYGIDSRGNYYESDYFWALKNPLPQNVDGFWIADGYKATIVKTNKRSGVVTRDVWKTSSDGYYKLNHDVYAYRVYVSKMSEVLNSTYSGVYALIFKRVGCVAVREDIDELHEADRYYHTLAKCAIKRKYEIGFANSDDYLHLATYDGSGQFVHPKVLYKDAGIFGHKYWMAYTPYPNADVSKENPCIAYSDDGVNWTNISANPLDLPDDNGTVNYNSDTHLVYREDTKTLECWYRNADSTNQVEKIYRRTTTDGVNWSARELLKQTNGLSNLLSPAIIYDADNHKYKIWVVCASGGYHLDYYESTSGDSWSFIKELHFSFDYNGETYTLWHVDVDWIDNRYRVLCMCDDANGVGMLFYTSSYSNANYDTPVPVMVGRAGRWDLRLYRSCLVKCGNMYRIYYSGVNKVTGTREYRVGISESDELGKFVGFVID